MKQSYVISIHGGGYVQHGTIYKGQKHEKENPTLLGNTQSILHKINLY